MKHRKYPEKVKILISRSQNPYLFPELKIPVSTAKYWIQIKYHNFFDSSQANQNYELRKLKEENRELKRRIHLIKKVQTHANLTIKHKYISDLKTKELIINTIKKYKGRKSLTSALNDIDLTTSRYKRWSKEIRNNEQNPSFHSYKQKHPRSLTINEFHLLCFLYTSPKYFHYPLYSLSLKARRLNLLNISPATWSKYSKQYKLKRPKVTYKKKSGYPVGIRRSEPNNLWHMDVTEIRINKRKYYIQAIIDNHSRFIVGWQLLKQWSAESTLILLKTTIKKHNRPGSIMSDAGKENLNGLIRVYLKKNGIKFYIAKLNTRYSNSIVEILFRTFKSNYLKHFQVSTVEELIKHIEFYFNEYNNEIPHSALNGRTPEEVYYLMPKDYYSEDFKMQSKASIQKRIHTYKN